MKLQVLTASAITFAPAAASRLSTVSWADPRIDIFGIAPDSFWHKYYTGWDWQPSQGFERIPSSQASFPSVTTWGEGRLDLVYVNASGTNVLHKYYAGGNWEGPEDLGGEVQSVSAFSWGPNRLDIVAKKDDSYFHKAWTGTEWYPSISEWEDFGGNLTSEPAIGSWGPGRLDVIGISSDSEIIHKYWHEGWSKWESLGGGPFIGTPKITSWGPNRLDIWAVGDDGQLNHLAWDGTQYLKWEKLGGEFEDTPDVAHWNVSKIDIVGKTGDRYQLKNYDGSQWNPSSEGWYKLASSYSSEPSVLARRETNFFSVFGIVKDNSLRLQLWSGYGWEPSGDSTWSLGDLPKLDDETHKGASVGDNLEEL